MAARCRSSARPELSAAGSGSARDRPARVDGSVSRLSADQVRRVVRVVVHRTSMIHLRVKPAVITPDDLVPAISALRSGGVVAFPTETFYGLAVDPRSALAVKRVFELKRRGADQPLPLIAADVDQVIDHVGTMTPLASRL